MSLKAQVILSIAALAVGIVLLFVAHGDNLALTMVGGYFVGLGTALLIRGVKHRF